MTASRLLHMNPIRVAGFLGLFFLAGPGTLAGAAMLLAHAGMPLPLHLPHPATHAKLQLAGFFLLLIWGYLVHGLSGMLGADLKRTRYVIPWMFSTAAWLFALWLSDSLGAAPAVRKLFDGLLLLSVTAGSSILVRAGIRGTHRWQEQPYPMLLVPLTVPPAAVLLWMLDMPGARAAAETLLLWGSIAPIVIAMGFRMFSSMVRMRFPHERMFGLSSVLWGAGVVWLAGSSLGGPGPAWAGKALCAAGALGFTAALRVFEPRRVQRGKVRHIAVDASLVRHIRAGFAFFVAGWALAAAAAFGLLPGAGYYWNDVARHYGTIGFLLVVVAGITQRLFPSFLRARPSSARWMDGTLILLTAGTLLRTAEAFLPAGAPWVAASAAMLYAGVLGFAVHALLPLCHWRKRRAAEMEPSRNEQNVEHCSAG